MTSSRPTTATDRPNVLITSASRKVLLVRAFRDALGRSGGGRVLAADLNEWAASLYEADGVVALPGSDDPSFADDLRRACAAEGIGLVVPTRDGELAVMADLADLLASDGTIVLVPSRAAVETCRDKVRFAAAVARAGLDSPRILDPSEARFPAFVKDREGSGARSSAVVWTQPELSWAMTTLKRAGREPLVQEFIEGPEFSVDVFIDPDGHAISCVPRERVEVADGESVISRTVRDPELSEATLRLCAAIELTGHVTVQAFRSRERIAFIDLNPRFGGAANLGFAAGARTPEFAIRAVRGERLQPQLEGYEVDLVMVRHAEDRFVRRPAHALQQGGG